MVKSSKPEPPRPTNPSVQQMKAAIPKLELCLKDLQEVDISKIQKRGEARFAALKNEYNSTLADIFGTDTYAYNQFCIATLDTAPLDFGRSAASIEEVREGYKQGIDKAISNLKSIIKLFKEKIEDSGETSAGRALRAHGGLELHPDIELAISKLFRDGHYAEAVEKACNVLKNLVQNRSGRHDLDGTQLMQTVFSPNNPILKFNELENQTDKDEQQGMMFLYAGAMLAFRNPRAHAIIEDEPEAALEYIAFLSLLVKSLSKTKA